MSSGNRIKYIDHKFKKGHVISTKAYTSKTNGAKYRIILRTENKDDLQYYIRNERTKEYVFKSRIHTNLNVLKRNARAELERFGVQLKRESRARCFGLCPEGYNQEQWELEQKLKFEFKTKDEL